MIRLLLALVGAALLAPACACAGALPPPAASVEEGTVFVELVVNGEEKGVIVPLQVRGEALIVDGADLAANGVTLTAHGPIDLSRTPGVRASYDIAGQRLLVDLAARLLPTHHVGAPERERHDSVSQQGALLNYTVNVQHSGGRSGASVWSEQRWFDGSVMLSNNGTLGWGLRGHGGLSYIRYDTHALISDDGRALVATVGDLITKSLPWSTSVRMAGLQLARDFRIRPDLLTMPLPSFAGEAAVPSAVDLFVDGYRQQSTRVAPGRFVLDNMPMVNGAGEATIVTTDPSGRQVATVIPFYVASELLKPGLLDGSAEIGLLRRAYGIRNFAYGAAVASGSVRYGLTARMTVEAHGEAASAVQLAGVGIGWAPTRFGVLDASIAASRTRGTAARQISVGYAYRARRFSIAVQHIERGAGYRDLGSFDLARFAGSRRSDRLVATAQLPGRGALALAFAQARTGDNSRTRIASLSFSRPIGRSASVFVGIDRDFAGRSTSMQFRLIVPFGRGSIGGGISRAAGRGAVGQLDYGRAMPSDGGLGVSASIGGSSHGRLYGQASAQWRARSVQFEGGFAAAGQTSLWAGATGTIAVLDGDLFAAPQVADAFAVVSTDGVRGVPISYENQVVGVTNRRGHLFVPGITAYHPGLFALDPLALDEGLVAKVVEARASLRAGAGAVVHMPVRRSRSFTVALVDETGRPLEPGGIAGRADGRQATVGWDGLVFLEDVAPHEQMKVTRPDGRACRASVLVPANASTLATIGPVRCA